MVADQTTQQSDAKLSVGEEHCINAMRQSKSELKFCRSYRSSMRE